MAQLKAVPALTKWGLVSVPGAPAPASTGFIVANSDGNAVPQDFELASSALAGAGCPQAEGIAKYTAALTVASEWLVLDVTGQAPPDVSASQRDWLAGASGRAWVANAAAALRRCDLSSVTAPPGWSTAESGFHW